MQTYFMIGAGGTGTHLLPAMLAYLRAYHNNEGTEYQVVVADGDIFEEKNHTRQIFDDGMIKINKADAMLQMYPGHPMIAVTRYVGKADLETMMQDGDVVLICADNYSVRALVADRAAQLDNCVVVNAGNETWDGSVQLWIREDGKNVTPAITYGHPEIAFIAEDDRAGMDCLTVAQLPGGEQTMLANMTAATFMLAALTRWHRGAYKATGNGQGWTELQYDHLDGYVHMLDMRERRNWDKNPTPIETT